MTLESTEEPAPLRVLEIVGNAIIGGTERYVRGLIEGLRGQDCDVWALCPFESTFTSDLRKCGCQVHIAMLEEALEWRSLLVATEVIRHHQIDVIQSHLFNATFLGSLAGSLTGVPVAITVHGMYVNPEELALARLTGSHMITVCTAAYMMGLSLGMPEEQISLIPNGVDTERFRPDLDGTPFRQQIQVPEGAPLVGMVARLSREKGPDLFVQAASLVAAERRDVHFVLVGDGPLHDDLAAQIDSLGFGDRFHLPGVIPETHAVYPALDVVCLPSRIEGQPLTLLEAMAAGRPVVATSVGGIPEIVQMGQTGWLVAQGDAKSMSERILWLLNHRKEAQQMGRAGRQRAVDCFDLRNQTAMVGQLLRRLVENRRPRALARLRMGRVYGQVRVS